MSLELIIANTAVEIPQIIENLEALKAELPAMLEMYKNLVVTEESMKQAKEDRAKLNTLKKAIDAKRIETKKEIYAYFEPLEAQFKEITNMIDEPVQLIDKQVKAFEEKAINDKLMEIKTAFYRLDKPEWLEFDKVLPVKWQNKTEKLSKVIDDMTKAVESIVADVAAIKADFKDKPYFSAIAMHYKNTLNKADAYVYAAKLQQEYEERQKAAEAEQARQAAEAQKAAEQQPEVVVEVPAPVAEAEAPAQPSEMPQETTEKLVEGCFKVKGTAAQIKALGAYMKSNGIAFEIVK